MIIMIPRGVEGEDPERGPPNCTIDNERRRSIKIN